MPRGNRDRTDLRPGHDEGETKPYILSYLKRRLYTATPVVDIRNFNALRLLGVHDYSDGYVMAQKITG